MRSVAPVCGVYFLLALVVLTAHGQSWRLRAGGRDVPWEEVEAWPTDSLRQGALAALRHLQREAYLDARIDSHTVDVDGNVTLFATLGERAAVSCIRLNGVAVLGAEYLKSLMTIESGTALVASTLESDINTLLHAYVQAGYPLAEIIVAALGVEDASCLTLEIREGRMPVLAGIRLSGASRTRSDFVAKIAGLEVGRPIGPFLPDNIHARLQDSGVFRNVGKPALTLDDHDGVVIQIPVDEGPPGMFDLALGYEPAQEGRKGARLVGAGHLTLRNVFGAGRQLSFEIRRPPRQISRLNIHIHDPFFFGFPIRTEISFNGLQQDSTFSKRRYEIEVGYSFWGNLVMYATMAREVNQPGREGLVVENGMQRIAESHSTLLGAGTRYSSVASQVSPRSGLEVDWAVERGRRNSYRSQATEDGVGLRTVRSQARLRSRLRVYLPVSDRQVAVVGGEANVLGSVDADAGDYFRMGGAATLRGYDEEQFAAPFVTRTLLEYRYLIDQVTYGAVFFDMGYVGGVEVAAFYPGYGLGVQVGVPVGIVAFSVAAATRDPSAIRAHIRLAMGL